LYFDEVGFGVFEQELAFVYDLFYAQLNLGFFVSQAISVLVEITLKQDVSDLPDLATKNEPLYLEMRLKHSSQEEFFQFFQFHFVGLDRF
jgi:hypothetical protein